MKALCWFGKRDVRITDVAEAKIINPRDAVIKVTTAAVCGSDLHLYNGVIATMQRGDILGHEFMGYVVDVGSAVQNIKIGDRVVVPFPIACGHCYYCTHDMWSLCDNSNPNAYLAEKILGYATSGIYGYSHMMGGYAGGQAEYVRVPFADVGCLKVPNKLRDEQVLFLSDIFPTAYMAAENCNINPGDTVAVWGCGPVGQLAIRSAYLLGAKTVIAIDRIPERLAMAVEYGRAIALNSDNEDVGSTLKILTGGRGPDACIEAVGMEAHGSGFFPKYDALKQKLGLTKDKPQALREAIYYCRKGGTVSVAGAYGGLLDKIPFGSALNKSLTFKMGQTHVHRYMRPLLKYIENGDIDPSYIITHTLPLSEAPKAYKIFNKRQAGCVKMVLKPAT